MRRLFGTDGIRDIANERLSAERATGVGRALGCVLSSGGKYRPHVIIGYDTRLSSEMLAASLTAGLFSAGADVSSVGVIPTPAIAYLTRHYGCTAGIMISASHNPFEYNGIKIFSSDGVKLSDELEEEIESMVLDNTPPIRTAEHAKIGGSIPMPNAKEDYIQHLLSAAPTDLSGMKIALDLANGAATQTAKRLFSRLSCELHIMNDSPNGTNINRGCGSTDMRALAAFVTEHGYDLGLAFDGDADRCLAIDGEGREVDGDLIMAILALGMMKRGELRGGTVVGTVMTNLGFIRFCRDSGLDFHATKVGDRYVLEAMTDGGYTLGGEQSGHIIIGNLETTGDGELTALMLLREIKEHGKSLAALSRVMKRYPQKTFNIPAGRDEKLSFLTDERVRDIIKETEAALGESGRIVARPSGTEPYIRIMIEAESEGRAEEIGEACVRGIREALGIR